MVLGRRIDPEAVAAFVADARIIIAHNANFDRRFAEAIEAFPLSRRAVLWLFRVRCSANRSGDPIVAEKRPDYYVINYPELQAWIEIAHRPLIEVNDAARR